MLDQSFLDSLNTIKWFNQCGEPLTLTVPLPVQPIATWGDAIDACSKPEWENTTLEASNILTAFLHQNARSRYQDWNKTVRIAKEHCINPLTETVWLPFSREHSLDITFIDCVRWDVLGAIMEHVYSNVRERPTFFLHLLSFYKAGHFPCGWVGGTYPNGTLQVF